MAHMSRRVDVDNKGASMRAGEKRTNLGLTISGALSATAVRRVGRFQGISYAVNQTGNM